MKRILAAVVLVVVLAGCHPSWAASGRHHGYPVQLEGGAP